MTPDTTSKQNDWDLLPEHTTSDVWGASTDAAGGSEPDV